MDPMDPKDHKDHNNTLYYFMHILYKVCSIITIHHIINMILDVIYMFDYVYQISIRLNKKWHYYNNIILNILFTFQYNYYA